MKYTIKAGYLIDGKNPQKNNIQIEIEDKKIKNILGFNNKNINEKEEKCNKIINAEKYTVLPGLIDAHVHITMNPGYIEAWEKWLKEKKEILLLKSAENAKEMLLSGVTTARDCGAYGDLAFLLRESIERRIVSGPRLIISGNPITTTGGHCYYMGLEADNRRELIKSVRVMNKLGADFIKLMSTGGRLTPRSNPRLAQYSLEETQTVVKEAHQKNMKVAAHALGIEGIMNSIKAGVDTIEHFACLSPDEGFSPCEEIFPEIAEKSIYIDPTLLASSLSQISSSINTINLFKERVKSMKKLYHSGIKMIAGTDAGVPKINFRQLPLSIKLLADNIGLTNYEAIKAGTSDAAHALGIDKKVGTIEKGKLADIIILDGNPLEDLENLKKIVMIMKGGEIVFEDSIMRI